MSAHILVVGDGKEIPGLIRAAGGAGTRTSVLCRLGVVAGLRDHPEQQWVLGASPDAPTEQWVELARALHAIDPVTAVGTFGERDQDRAAAVAQALGLPMHHPDTVAAVHDKALMRKVLREKGVDDTPAAVVATLDEARAFAAEHGYPLIAKPVRGAGSTSVSRVDGDDDLAVALAAAGAVTEWTSGGVLLERLHPGPQVSVEAIGEAGEHVVVAVCAKVSETAAFVELGHRCPAPLSAGEHAAIADLVPAVLAALGVEFGVTHTELVLTAEGPRVIETHVRPAGDDIPVIVRDATGIDLIELAARQTAGEKVLPEVRAALAEPPSRGSAIWFTAPGVDGVLRAVEGVEAARAVPGVAEVSVLLAPGATTGPLRSSRDRGLAVRAVAETAEAALVTAKAAAEEVAYVVEHRGRISETV